MSWVLERLKTEPTIGGLYGRLITYYSPMFEHTAQ